MITVRSISEAKHHGNEIAVAHDRTKQQMHTTDLRNLAGKKNKEVKY